MPTNNQNRFVSVRTGQVVTDIKPEDGKAIDFNKLNLTKFSGTFNKTSSNALLSYVDGTKIGAPNTLLPSAYH